MSTTLAPSDAAVEGAGGVGAYVSASRLNLWLRCPLAFKFRYVDGMTTPPTASLFVGQRIHDALEFYYRHRQLGVALVAEQLTERIAATWEEAAAADGVVFATGEEETAARQQVQHLAAAYLRHVSPEEPLPLAVETSLQAPLVDPLTGEDLGIPLVGILDLVLDSPAGPMICDFKSASSATPPLAVTHEIQLTCYAYLLRQATGQQEAGLEIRSLIKTKTPKIAFHPFEARQPQHFRRLFAVIRAYLDDLEQRQFVYRPGWTCGMCEFSAGTCGERRG